METMSRQCGVLSILINWWEAARQIILGKVSNCAVIAH